MGTLYDQIRMMEQLNRSCRTINAAESKSRYKRYLIREQGFEEDVVNGMSLKELRETYEYYNES